MALAAGSRIGAYEIVGLLGEGGMGEVYRATDSHLKRSVAIKVLPASVAGDADRLARFQREAEVLAALNHPNIAAIYELEKTPDLTALVMELVEGEDLSLRIARGAIPIDEAVPIAKQIAEALEAAHEQGIIHRDLKPANVKVRPDGTVKVLDFGLAKAIDPTEPRGFSPGDQANSPTLTAHATHMGVILGTAAYMAPEQARGRVVDKRADIWAFGAVLYEMLTGRRAFEGDDVSSTLAAVLKDDVKWAALPADVPAPIRTFLRRCLEKDPRRRLQAIGEARILLEDPATLAPAPSAGPAAPRRRQRLWMAAAALSTLAAIGAGVWIWTRPSPAPPRPVQFTVAPPDGSVFGTANSLAISPDGEQLAFGATMNGKHQLWVRALDSLTPRLLPGTDSPANAFQPVWSPNGRHVAFNSGSKLMRADVAGGPPMTLADPIGASGGAGGLAAWSQQGVILFSRDGHLYRIPEGGGQGVAVTELDKTRRETAHRWPIFLPDGRRFIFLADTSDPSMAALYLASLDSPGRTHLIDVRSSVAYAQGHLFYQRDGTLMAQPFDERAGRLAGGAEPVVENVEYNPGTGRAAFSVSADGTLACRTRASGVNGTLTWFDRQGKRLAVAGQPGNIGWFQISPDGRTVAVAQSDATSRPLGAGTRGAQLDIWTIDLERNVRTRLTSDPADENSPVWSADGRWIFFRSNRKGIGNLYRRASGGGGADELLFESPDGKTPTSASRDGKLLIFERFVSSEKGSNDIWALPLEGEKRPFSVIATPFNDANGALSPDGRWIAYQSMESGDWQIYVQPFPPTGERVRVSTATGGNPQWSADGKQLYFNTVSSPRRLHVADVSTPLRPGIPKELFSNTGGYTIGVFGDRILLNVPPEGTSADPAPITVVLNVTATLKR